MKWIRFPAGVSVIATADTIYTCDAGSVAVLADAVAGDLVARFGCTPIVDSKRIRFPEGVYTLSMDEAVYTCDDGRPSAMQRADHTLVIESAVADMLIARRGATLVEVAP